MDGIPAEEILRTLEMEKTDKETEKDEEKKSQGDIIFQDNMVRWRFCKTLRTTVESTPVKAHITFCVNKLNTDHALRSRDTSLWIVVS